MDAAHAQVITCAPGASAEAAADPVERILTRLGRTHGEREVGRYFAEAARLRACGGDLEVTVPTEFAAHFLDRRFGRSLRDAAAAELATREDDISVRFRVDRDAFGGSSRSEEAIEADPGESRDVRAGAVRSATAGAGERLVHRLEDFLVGESNRLAYAAALVLAEGDGARHPPLFLHGACGVGKTHLVHGVARRFRELRPDARVMCTTGEAFTNSFVTAIRMGGIEKFRRAHRGLKLLCIDDVHLIAGKSATQNELLHTLDSLNLEGARIILASDCHPRQSAALGQALISRFMAGAVIRVDLPDPDLCRRLVQMRADRRGLPIEPAAVDAITQRASTIVGSSARDIEGMVMQVEAVWRGMPELRTPAGAVGLHVVERALGAAGLGSRIAPRRAVRAEDVVEAVCGALSIEPGEMSSKGRHPRVVFARAVAAYLSREMTTCSYPEIARAIGRPTHSTVVMADKRLRERLDGAPGVELGEEFAGLTVRGVCARIAEELSRATPRGRTSGVR